MSDSVKPLFPDDFARRYECWNCGKGQHFSVAGRTASFLCECGCGWTNRYNMTAEVEAGQKELRAKILASQLKMELVDFTLPGARSAPA